MMSTKSKIFLAVLCLGFFQSGSAMASDPVTAQAEVMSSDSFIRFNDLNMKFRNGSDLATQGVLGKGSVIQLPGGVTEYNASGGIDLNKTIEQWLQKAEQDPAYIHHRPRYRRCPGEQEKCRDPKTGETIDTNEIYLPIKVVRSSDPNIKIDDKSNFGYVAIDYIQRNIDASRYKTVRTTLDAALAVEETPVAVADPAEDTVATDAGGETTQSLQSPRPPAQRPQFTTPTLNHAVRNCDDRSYRSSGYGKNNCLVRKGMSLKQKAELVMSDVLEVNRLRKVKLDPRFSLCIAQKESCISPNAKGGSPDWGLFQVINSTARNSLKKMDPVTPGFSKYRYNWGLYRTNMLQSTLAQADLHQSVILSIANWKGYFAKIRNGTMRDLDYYNMARHYNGGNNIHLSQVKKYGQSILNCLRDIKGAVNSRGQIFNPNKLEPALNRANKCSH